MICIVAFAFYLWIVDVVLQRYYHRVIVLVAWSQVHYLDFSFVGRSVWVFLLLGS